MKSSLRFRRLIIIFACIFLSSNQLFAQTFEGVSSIPADDGSQAGPTATITPPTGMAAGDLVVIYAHYRGSGENLSLANTGGQTWTNETTDDGSTQTFDIFWCRFDGTWIAPNPSVTVGAGNTAALTAVMYVFRPTSAANSWGVHMGPNNSSSGTTNNNSITGYNVTVPNTVTMAFWGNAAVSQWSDLQGAGWSKASLSAQYRNNTGSNQSHTSAYNIRTTTGTIAAVSQDQTGTTATALRSILTWFEFTPPPPPTNDPCSSAISLTFSTTCNNTSGSLLNATASSPIVPTNGTSCAGTPGADVWYSFTAQTAYPTISLSSMGASFRSAGVRLQLFSGSCGSLTSLDCETGTSLGSTATLSLTTNTLYGNAGLTVGNTYYVRVYSPTTAPASGTWGFNICVRDPIPSTIDYSRSYINITKGTVGGTVDPGDILEMRTTFVVRGSSSTPYSADSLAIYDTLFNGNGLKLVPGSIAWRTNEGKIYGNGGSAFTDAVDADPGWTYTSGLDTVVRLNFGIGSTRFARGRLAYNSRPLVWGSTSIIMATYRVEVYAPYNTTINFKTGALTYRDANTGVLSTVNFAPNNLMVYQSPGLCPNAVSPSNTLGAEDNGTFGTPSNPAPLARNRGTSPNTSYSYKPFTPTGGPDDYYYTIANNTSARYTTINTWNKPDASSPVYRLFNQWDITGDHTNASNPLIGNPACDTTLPVSTTNPCGYMLVINSAYRADTAFTHTITGLCPSTYYEISAWFKNICYKCGCDSTGTGAGSAGYIPTAPGDSSGVRPNIAFDVNGIDYYTTGDLVYQGLSGGPTGSDAANRWVKKGFTYLTGPAQTSFTLTLRNNAPGGGGNDWALDDIAVATCSPDLSFTPSANPTICAENVVDIGGTVQSYFNNYVNYQWQKSTDDGVTWADDGSPGTGTPTLNGGEYEYTVNYPQFVASQSDSGTKYRLVVATTPSNLGTVCALSGSTDLTLSIDPCIPVLGTSFISFNAKQNGSSTFLYWTTSKETEVLNFTIEGSTDGRVFNEIGELTSSKIYTNSLNSYTWSHAQATSKYFYRIKMVGVYNGLKYSKVITMDGLTKSANLISVNNPFQSQLVAGVQMTEAGTVRLELINNNGVIVQTQHTTLQQGLNRVELKNVGGLPPGMYTLKFITNKNVVSKKLIKQ